MYEEDDMAVDAELEDAADSPIEEDESLDFDEDDETDDGLNLEDEDPEGADAGKPGKDAREDETGSAAQKEKPAQSREDDSRYAAARRTAEAQAKAAYAEAQTARERMDAFARQHGHEDFAAMEAHERTRQYVKDGMPEAAACELSGMRAELEGARREREQAEAERQDRQRWAELFSEFPETRALDDLPDDVYALIHAGESPVNAYRAVKLRELEGENTAFKQNDATRKKAIGSLRGRGLAADRPQPFLEGLLGK